MRFCRVIHIRYSPKYDLTRGVFIAIARSTLPVRSGIQPIKVPYDSVPHHPHRLIALLIRIMTSAGIAKPTSIATRVSKLHTEARIIDSNSDKKCTSSPRCPIAVTMRMKIRPTSQNDSPGSTSWLIAVFLSDGSRCDGNVAARLCTPTKQKPANTIEAAQLTAKIAVFENTVKIWSSSASLLTWSDLRCESSLQRKFTEIL